MLILKKVAVTGGISSGKTTVCRFLKDHGAYVISADEVVHQLLSPKTAIGQRIIQLLGKDVVIDDTFDKKKISKKVFSDPEKLRSLETILHPAVLQEIETHYEQLKKAKKYPLFVAEVPLLFESESEPFFDTVIAVIAPEALSRQRFQEGRQEIADEFDKRMARQMLPEEKAAKADFVLSNEGSLLQLKQKVEDLYPKLLKS